MLIQTDEKHILLYLLSTVTKLGSTLNQHIQFDKPFISVNYIKLTSIPEMTDATKFLLSPRSIHSQFGKLQLSKNPDIFFSFSRTQFYPAFNKSIFTTRNNILLIQCNIILILNCINQKWSIEQNSGAPQSSIIIKTAFNSDKYLIYLKKLNFDMKKNAAETRRDLIFSLELFC